MAREVDQDVCAGRGEGSFLYTYVCDTYTHTHIHAHTHIHTHTHTHTHDTSVWVCHTCCVRVQVCVCVCVCVCGWVYLRGLECESKHTNLVLADPIEHRLGVDAEDDDDAIGAASCHVSRYLFCVTMPAEEDQKTRKRTRRRQRDMYKEEEKLMYVSMYTCIEQVLLHTHKHIRTRIHTHTHTHTHTHAHARAHTHAARHPRGIGSCHLEAIFSELDKGADDFTSDACKKSKVIQKLHPADSPER